MGNGSPCCPQLTRNLAYKEKAENSPYTIEVLLERIPYTT